MAKVALLPVLDRPGLYACTLGRVEVLCDAFLSGRIDKRTFRREYEAVIKPVRIKVDPLPRHHGHNASTCICLNCEAIRAQEVKYG